MKSLMLLMQGVLKDFEDRCTTSTVRDLKTITERSNHEGLSFLTITLAKFGKDFQKSLDLACVAPTAFAGFRRSGGLPLFLGGFLERVFDRSTGQLLDAPCIDAIFAVRQITLMWAKIEVDCSPERVSRAYAQFIECEKEMHEYDGDIRPRDLAEFQRVSAHLFGLPLHRIESNLDGGSAGREVRDRGFPLFRGTLGTSETSHGELECSHGRSEDLPHVHQRPVRPMVERGLSLLPRHGPGATADYLKGNQKYSNTTWTWRLEEAGLTLREFLSLNDRWLPAIDSRVQILEPGAELPVRVIAVPKTLETPRIIAIEPTCMQYVQQAIRRELYDVLEDSKYPARGMVGFTDQGPNRALACTASKDGSLATLDLSEASDRVSNQLVREMLRNTPRLQAMVDACRSRKADVPEHGVVRLAKFASMGSALTFPIEAMVFLTVVFIGIGRELSCPVTPKLIQSLSGRVRVYGDDIIVPVEYVGSVVQALSDFGQKVNSGKSFWTGKFRESCGGDYYDGWDVTPVRVRSPLLEQRGNASQVISAISLRNQLYKAGLWKATAVLDELLERENIPMPVVRDTSAIHGRHSFLDSYQEDKFDEDLHTPLVRGVVATVKLPENEISGHDALMKTVYGRETVLHPLDFLVGPLTDADHLQRSGRPDSVRIKIRWASPL